MNYSYWGWDDIFAMCSSHWLCLLVKVCGTKIKRFALPKSPCRMVRIFPLCMFKDSSILLGDHSGRECLPINRTFLLESHNRIFSLWMFKDSSIILDGFAQRLFANKSCPSATISDRMFSLCMFKDSYMVLSDFAQRLFANKSNTFATISDRIFFFCVCLKTLPSFLVILRSHYMTTNHAPLL